MDPMLLVLAPLYLALAAYALWVVVLALKDWLAR